MEWMWRTAVIGWMLVGLCSRGQGLSEIDRVWQAALVPGADVVLRFEVKEWREAPVLADRDFSNLPLVSRLGRDTGEGGEETPPLFQTLGDSGESVVRIAFSADLAEVGLRALRKGRLDTSVLAVELESPVSWDELRRRLREVVAAEEDMEFDSEQEYRGTRMLVLRRTDDEENPAHYAVSLKGGDRVVLTGGVQGVKGALDRHGLGEAGTPSVSCQGALSCAADADHLVLAFVPDRTTREKIGQQAAKVQTRNPLMGSALLAIRDMEGLSVAASARDRIDVAFTGLFASEQGALQVKNVLDMMVLGMARMTMERALGRPIPLFESMETTSANGRTVFRFSLVNEDLDTLGAAAATGMVPFGGAPQPGTGAPPAQAVPIPAP